MKIAIYGGSFSPVHKGHTRLANYVASNKIADLVLMMPCYKSLYNKELPDGDHRLAMITASKRHHNVHSYEWEIKNKVSDLGTYQIMQMLEKEFIFDDLYFIIGLDNSQKVKTWKNGDKILDNTRFIVAPRNDIEVTDNWFLKEPHIFLDKYKPDTMSSTQVRQLLKENKGTTKYLDNTVKDYITSNHLYTANTPLTSSTKVV